MTDLVSLSSEQGPVNIELATLESGGTIASVFGRTGAVVANSGDYAVAQITGAAPLVSPALTGTPTAPTAAHGTNTTQIATTAFVLANAGTGLPAWYIIPVITPARTVTDAVTNNSSAIITSATANFTSADVGACVIVYNSAASNTIDPTVAGTQPTIVSVTNSTTAVVSSPFVGTATGLTAVIGQDASAGLNAAFALAIAAEGILLVPPGQYIINTLNLFFTSITNQPVTIQGAGFNQSQLIPSPYLLPSAVNGPIVFLQADITWVGLDMNWLGINGGPMTTLVDAIGWQSTGSTRLSLSQFIGWDAQATHGNSVVKCDSDDFSVEHVRVVQNWPIGMNISSLNYTALDCDFISVFDAGVQTGDLSWGKITNCTIQGGTTALNLAGGSGGGHANWLVNCWFGVTSTGGINVQSSANCDANFVGCSFTGAQGGYTGFPGVNISGINNVSPSTINCTNCIFLPTGTGYGVTNASGGVVVLTGCNFVNIPSSSWTGKALINAGTAFDGGGNQALLSNITNTGTLVTGSN